MRRFAALLAVVFLAACTNEIDQSTRPDLVAGSYQLRAYGGRQLPAVVSSDSSGVLEITGGSLVIGADNSWSESQDYRLTKGTMVRLASAGSSGSWVYFRDFASMTFNDKVYNYQFTGTVAGGSVTLELENGSSFMYSR
jgi:ABC-type phosphate transport system substrate-binding protein